MCSTCPKPMGPEGHSQATHGVTNHTVDSVIIGGGQAGLAAGYYLQRLNRDAGRNGSEPALSFAILDANEHPGGAWQHYWDTLELFSPAAYSSLPGWPMPFWPGPGNPSAAHVVSYLKAYEERYNLRPVMASPLRALHPRGRTIHRDTAAHHRLPLQRPVPRSPGAGSRRRQLRSTDRCRSATHGLRSYLGNPSSAPFLA